MKVLVVVSAVLAVAAAQYLPYSGYGYSGYPYAAGYWNGYAAPYWNYAAAPYTTYAAAPHTTYAAAPYARYGYAAAPAVASSQYHAQNELGGYTYGYADGLSTKTESKNAYGGTAGSYSYVDANGKVQTVNYVADAAGFRVSGTNLPVAPVADLKAPVHSLVGPAPVEDTPEVKAAKAEFRSAFAAAAAAAEQDATPVVTVAGPAPVEDTVEVKAAKAEFRQLYAEAAAAAAAAPDARKKRSLVAPLPVEDTDEVKAAKAEHAKLYAAAAAAAEAAPDFDYPLAYAGHYGAYAPLAYNAPAFYRRGAFSYGFNSAHFAYPYARYFY